MALLVLGVTACSSPTVLSPAGTAAAPATGPVGTSVASSATAGPRATSPGSASPSPSPSPSASPSPSPTSSTPPKPPSCATLAGRLSLDEQVGQLLMVAVSSTGPSRSQASVLGDVHAGSVLLLGNSTAGVAKTKAVVAKARSAAGRPHGVRALLAADQEGGLVQRLRGPGFSRIPSARAQARLSDAELTRRARSWGRQLARAGIDANLAPVADVVPKALVTVNQPIGRLQRGYGSSPATVARKVRAFTRGMDASGTATAVKHFPGLGRVRGNTDTASHVVDATTRRSDPGLRGFRAGVTADTDMVMTSSAFYSRIDARRQAAFSRTVVTGMLRGDLGFSGVVVSDDLAAAKAVADVPVAARPVRFLRAGGDLVIVGDPALARPMAKALRDEARADPAFARLVRASVTRVLVMKARRELSSCGG